MPVRLRTSALPAGIRYLPGHFDRAAQAALVDDIRSVVEAAPLYVPAMPKTGKEMSVRMTNCGALGWVTDKERGYRYQATHPVTGEPWPPIPETLLKLWREVSDHPQPPQACLVNFYSDSAKMGLHQDRDESDFSAPGGLGLARRRLPVPRRRHQARRPQAILPAWQAAMSSCSAGKPARLPRRRPHLPVTSTLLKNGGRINLTLRRVTPD